MDKVLILLFCSIFSLPTDQDCHELWSKLRKRKMRQEQKLLELSENPADNNKGRSEEKAKLKEDGDGNKLSGSQINMQSSVTGSNQVVQSGFVSGDGSSVQEKGEKVGAMGEGSQVDAGQMKEAVKVDENRDRGTFGVLGLAQDPGVIPGLDFDYGDSPEDEVMSDVQKKDEKPVGQLSNVGNTQVPQPSVGGSVEPIIPTTNPFAIASVGQESLPNYLMNEGQKLDIKNVKVQPEIFSDLSNPAASSLQPSASESNTSQGHATLLTPGTTELDPASLIPKPGTDPQAQMEQLSGLLKQLQQQTQLGQIEGATKEDTPDKLIGLLTLLQTAQSKAQLTQVIKHQQDVTTHKKLLESVNTQLMLAYASKQIEEQKRILENAQLIQQIGGLIQQKQEAVKQDVTPPASNYRGVYGNIPSGQNPVPAAPPVVASASIVTETPAPSTKTPGVLLALNQLISQKGMKLNPDLKLSKVEERENLIKQQQSRESRDDYQMLHSEGHPSQSHLGSGGDWDSDMYPPPVQSNRNVKPPTETMSLKAKMQTFFDSQHSPMGAASAGSYAHKPGPHGATNTGYSRQSQGFTAQYQGKPHQPAIPKAQPYQHPKGDGSQFKKGLQQPGFNPSGNIQETTSRYKQSNVKPFTKPHQSAGAKQHGPGMSAKSGGLLPTPNAPRPSHGLLPTPPPHRK